MSDCKVKCPHCGTEYKLDEGSIGSEFECANCNQNFIAGEPDGEKSGRSLTDLRESGKKIFSSTLAGFREKLQLRRNSESSEDDQNEKTGNSVCKVKCPHCGTEYELDEDSIGSEFECVNCNQSFIAQMSVRKRASETFKNLRESGKKIIGGTFPGVRNSLQTMQNRDDGDYDPDDEDDEDDDAMSEHRKALNRFFLKAETTRATVGFVAELLALLGAIWEFIGDILSWIANLFSVVPPANIVARFHIVWYNDREQLIGLDVLPRFGKHPQQLVAPAQTLFSPASDYEADDDGPEFKYAVCSDGNIFIYSLEEVTKLYTLEDQLFVFKAYWDYTTGELFSESSEAFFFKDITDISTKSSYEYVDIEKERMPWDEFWQRNPEKKKKIKFWSIILGIIVGFPTPFIEKVHKLCQYNEVGYVVFAFCVAVIGFFIIMLLMMWITYLRNTSAESCRKLVKRSETFSISASSGNSIGMTILCDDWIEAKKGNITERSDAERIIQSIRKMIEEKKVEADA